MCPSNLIAEARVVTLGHKNALSKHLASFIKLIV